ncbi:Lipid A core-O-antigen ligase [Halomonas sp. R57-5]|uniref:O-antigen ligase family protein n=1 Tax=Halomonas sp. R57-5 TaxID=1610576 RepID=UPI0005FCC983|nr:O-antigen ligase [Halomonas sp. R57-5]CEP36891.1 Lipid A core-O-antigen ligase [Halomonas sp. R57-5]
MPFTILEDSKSIFYASASVFIFGALSLVVPSGYSFGAVLLLIGGLALPLLRPQFFISRRDCFVMTTMALYAFTIILLAWFYDEGSRAYDRPSRLLLAIPALLFLLANPPRLSAMWSGFALGAIGAGGWALCQKLLLNTVRAGGYTHVIQFGNLSMLLGILCLAGMGWAILQPHRKRWLVLLALGAVMGILGSLLSGSRGGWVGFPLILLVLYRSYGKEWPLKWKGALAFGLVLGGVTVFALPQTGVQERVFQAVDDISLYVSGESQDTSVGARFEMWKGASHLISDRPILGWGQNGYLKGMTTLAEDGIVSAGILQFDHAHNEFLDTFAKRGLIGLAVLLLLYLVPMKLFSEYLRHSNLEIRAVAVAGFLLPVAYIDFGITQTFLGHNSGVMMYAFLLAILWGIHSRHRKQLN